MNVRDQTRTDRITTISSPVAPYDDHQRPWWFNAGTYIVIAALIVERRLARPWGGIRACALKVLTRYVIKCIFGGGVVVVVDQGLLLHSPPLLATLYSVSWWTVWLFRHCPCRYLFWLVITDYYCTCTWSSAGLESFVEYIKQSKQFSNTER